MISDQYKLALRLGDAATERGDIDAAIQHYQEALRLQPDCSDVYCRLGKLYYYNYQTTRAQHCFEI